MRFSLSCCRGKPEIYEFDDLVLSDHNIVWLDISVENTTLMQVTNSLDYLCCDEVLLLDRGVIEMGL